MSESSESIDTSETNETSEASSLYSSGDESIPIQCVEGTIDGIKIKFALDTGATASIMSFKTAAKFKFDVLPSNIKVKSQNNHIEKVRGITKKLSVKIGEHFCVMNFLVTNTEDHQVLLGLDWFFESKACFCPSDGVLRFQNDEILVHSRLSEIYNSNLENDEVLISQVHDSIDDFDIEDNIFPFDDKEISIRPASDLDKSQKDEFLKIFLNCQNIFALRASDLVGCNLGSHSIRTLNVPPIFVR